MRSFWLCKKASRKRALRYKVFQPVGYAPRMEFEIFEPTSDKDVHGGTVTRGACGVAARRGRTPPGSSVPISRQFYNGEEH